jgi:hypothetical protein
MNYSPRTKSNIYFVDSDHFNDNCFSCKLIKNSTEENNQTIRQNFNGQYTTTYRTTYRLVNEKIILLTSVNAFTIYDEYRLLGLTVLCISISYYTRKFRKYSC